MVCTAYSVMPLKLCRRLLPLGLVAAGYLLVGAGPMDEALFKFNGKSYSGKDLTTADQQQLYDIKSEGYSRVETLVEQAALNLYFDDVAKKEAKPRAEVENRLLAVPEPTDKDAQDWYEANKARIAPGYSFEKIAPQVKEELKKQSKWTKREELIGKIKKDGQLVFLGSEPVAPVVKLNIDGFAARGKPDAKVTIVEFADYQCPHCKAAVTVLDGLLKKYDGKLRLVFADFTIKGEFSELAAAGAYCAGEQGKFWEFHDLAYSKQHTLGAKDAGANLAKELNLDGAKFSACQAGDAAKKQVARGHAEADRIGLTGTPTIFINGKKMRGYEEADLSKAIEQALRGDAS